MPCSTMTLALDGSSCCTDFLTMLASRGRKVIMIRNGAMRDEGFDSIRVDAGN